MDTDEAPTVDERALYHVLARLRDLRREAVHTLADPWAFRQAMITVLAIDTAVALETGIEPDGLALFDARAQDKALEFIEEIPEGWGGYGR